MLLLEVNFIDVPKLSIDCTGKYLIQLKACGAVLNVEDLPLLNDALLELLDDFELEDELHHDNDILLVLVPIWHIGPACMTTICIGST